MEVEDISWCLTWYLTLHLTCTHSHTRELQKDAPTKKSYLLYFSLHFLNTSKQSPSHTPFQNKVTSSLLQLLTGIQLIVLHHESALTSRLPPRGRTFGMKLQTAVSYRQAETDNACPSTPLAPHEGRCKTTAETLWNVLSELCKRLCIFYLSWLVHSLFKFMKWLIFSP